MISLMLLLMVCGTAESDTYESQVVSLPTAIERGKGLSWTIAPVPRDTQSVLLEVRCRMEARGASGSMFFLRILVNGNEARPLPIRGGQRIVNRPLISPVAQGLSSRWYGEGGWRVVYAPDFRVPDGQSFYVGDPFTLVLDMTDLVLSDAKNHLEVRNSASHEVAARIGSSCVLWLDKLVVRSSDKPSPLLEPSTTEESHGEAGSGPAKFSGTVHRNGGFTIATRGTRYHFESSFTYPNAGWNHLAPDDGQRTPEQPGWSVAKTDGERGALVIAGGPDYRIERIVRFTSRRVLITDSITNRHPTVPLGLMIRHEMSLAGLAAPKIRLAGIPDRSLNDYHSPGNPSVHVGAGGEGIGMICEDDVFRNQARLYYADTLDGLPPAVGIRTEMLRLGPSETYSIRWAVYPVASSRYYDFINLVREDWGSNGTVLGAWLWGYDPDAMLAMPETALREEFTRLGLRVAIVGGGWVDKSKDVHRIGFGAAVLDEYWRDYRRRIRESAEKIRRSVPGARVLVYFNSQRDSSEAGPDRFRDSWLTDGLGHHVSTDWNGRFTRTYRMVATQENSFGQAMLAVADRYMDELRADGLYWDEMENTQFGTPEATYSLTDGHSCEIDPKNYTILREMGMTTLLGAGHRMQVVDRVLRRGGLILGNGPSCIRGLQRAGVHRMVEIQHNDRWCHEGNLQSPLGYLSSRRTAGDGLRALRQACLPVAISYDYEWTSRVFPFTPLEIHDGYLLGQERIVAAQWGNYGWPGSHDLVQIHRFGRTGKPSAGGMPTRIGREARTAITPEAGEVYVLERLPVSFTPSKGESAASVLLYSPVEIQLRVDSPAGGQLTIRDGTFPVRSGYLYRMILGDGVKRVVMPVRDRISVGLPARFRGDLRLTATAARGSHEAPP